MLGVICDGHTREGIDSHHSRCGIVIAKSLVYKQYKSHITLAMVYVSIHGN